MRFSRQSVVSNDSVLDTNVENLEPLTDHEKDVLIKQFDNKIFLSPHKSPEEKKKDAMSNKDDDDKAGESKVVRDYVDRGEFTDLVKGLAPLMFDQTKHPSKKDLKLAFIQVCVGGLVRVCPSNHRTSRPPAPPPPSPRCSHTGGRRRPRWH